ncbi:MAG: DUF1318 domain-containing protein [Acidobacteriota bacterium]
MKRTLGATILLLAALSCIHVVVNVYFPASEAKGALASLEDELLAGSPGKPPSTQEKPAQPATPQEPATPPKGPRESAWLGLLHPQVAYAAGSVTEEEIYNRIKSMPQVVEAYQRIGARMARVDALRQAGLVGEGNDGLLKPRQAIPDRRDQRTIEEENADRLVVIRGLAKAALLAQGEAVTAAALSRVEPDAAATFASLRREKAQAGWWIQMPDGSWRKK